MERKNIKVNYILNVILTMSSLLFSLVTFPYVTRVLESANMGKVSLATSVIYYFNMVAQLGIPTYGIRACAQVRENRQALSKVTQELFWINLGMSLVSYLLLLAAVFTVPKLEEEKALYLVMSVTILLTPLGMEWLYRAMEDYQYITNRTLLFRAVALIATFLLVHAKEDYVIYGAISTFSSSAAFVLNFMHAGKYIDRRREGTYNFRRHIRPVLSFFGIVCATMIYTNLDVVMLGFMRTDTDVGYYNTAVKVKTILVTVVATLGNVVLPRAAAMVEQGKQKEFLAVSRKAMNFTVLIALPMVVFFILFAKQSVLFLAGDGYLGSVAPMQAIMPSVLFIGMTNITGTQMLVSLGREGSILKSNIAGSVVDLALNAVLIPTMGAFGAAVGTLAAEIVVFIYQTVTLGKEYRTCFTFSWRKIILGTVLGSLASFWVAFLPIGSFWALLLAAILFFGVYGLTLLLTKDELAQECLNILLNAVSKGRKNTEN